MDEDRFAVTDRQWSLIERHYLGKKTDHGRRWEWSAVYGGGFVDRSHR